MVGGRSDNAIHIRVKRNDMSGTSVLQKARQANM